MVSISKNLTITKIQKLQFQEKHQQAKILESNLVSLLDSSINLNQTKQIHAKIIRNGVDQCCYVITKLIRVLNGRFDIEMDPYPVRVFQQVKNPNPFLYTAIIRGYVMKGLVMESVRMYKLMRRKGVGPVSFTFTALLKGYGGGYGVDFGGQIHGQVLRLGGFGFDLYVGNTLIDMYVRCERLDCARKVFDEMCEKDMISWTSLIVAYVRCGNMEEVGVLFDGMDEKDMVAWTTMVMGFSQNAKPREALDFGVVAESKWGFQPLWRSSYLVKGMATVSL